MNLTDAGGVAQALKGKEFPGVPTWLLAEAAQFIADELARADTSVTVEQARNAVKHLNENCQFDLTRTVARAWIDRKGFDFVIQKRLTQALINTDELDEAEKLAAEGAKLSEAAGLGNATAYRELAEYRGLLGRISKQRFVDTDDLDSLCQATNRYLEEYKRTNDSWPGINALACMWLERDNGAPPRDIALDQFAAGVFAVASTAYARRLESWEAASASEANLALGNCDGAELWLRRFLALENTKPFAIDSYARQLREVWHGDPVSATSCADRLAGIISRHIGRAQSRVTIAPSQVAAVETALQNKSGLAGLEKNFLGESSFTVEAISSLLTAFKSIGCVMNDKGERLGTGFLVQGSWLSRAWGDALVFVTNAHVISETVLKAIPVNSARVTFELDAEINGQRPQYKVAQLLYTSPPGNIGVINPTGADLDCTIVRLDGYPPGVAGLTASENLPMVSPRTKVFVAGHPRGAGLQIALHDSLLLDIDDDERLLHYRTPTDPGSSGSPVFNSSWQVISLHHAGTSTTPRLHGTGTYEANEGISMSAIRRKLNS